ncbi:hypothetical protein CEUSTIGMA_g3206.t1 [Chlamydomonas eustigma]|uniref:Uncharacterized protein n=1 Tax=Chlamydomonas eustigma TaxID=1157962 RepID=A0A250WY42_9CHLO|nr:hypothetical protein CEUSTIGMA_g3206.t1 [Chlamydomonas eustigma]|eukprot:GAX75763.1 hypothetical protein CEUSTIGMA_g3206.t1 [Chlamydomonas eustigma]
MRSYGMVSGLVGVVGAGGNVGSIVTQVIFFGGSVYSPQLVTVPQGLQWMGVMTLGVTLAVACVHFPMWGSMFFPANLANPDANEEEYFQGVDS